MVFIVSMKTSVSSHLHFFAFDFEIESSIYFLALNNGCQK